ncbi:MAG TPA: class F sortase [Acidimicrobiales bacterium]|nr:class F sortase [Acidimicrobiales bacterium]
MAGIPTEVDIPSIGVHAPIVPLGLSADGTVQVPDSFAAAGWYQGGPRPGDPGPAVILGHVDSFHGPAVFFRVKELSPGQLIDVASASGSRQFRVDLVATFPKDRFPTAMVYAPVPVPALRLVTCGGSFNEAQHRYLDNVVVFATEVSP